MTATVFLQYVYENAFIVFSICFIAFLIYFLLFRKAIASVADPLFLGITASAFSAGVVLTLLYLGEIRTYYFASFILTEISFVAFAIFPSSRSLKLKRLQPNLGDRSRYLVFHYILLLVFLLASVAYLAKTGIPLFQEVSRLDTFQNLGFITWILDVTWVAAPFSVLLKRRFLSRSSYFDYVIFGFVFFLFATKGGKSDLVYLLFALNIFSQITGSTSIKKIEKAFLALLPGILILITTAVLSTWNVEISPLKVLFERFILFGDVFFTGYKDDFLATIPKIGFIDYFFGGTLSSIRAILGKPSEDRFILGYAIAKFYYGVNSGMGPNARHNILGLILWGPYFSIAFSALCGLAFRICRKGVIAKNASMFYVLIYGTVNVYSFFFFIDPSLAVGYMIKIFIIILPLILLSCFIYELARYSKNSSVHKVQR